MGGMITSNEYHKRNKNAWALEKTMKRIQAYLNAIPDKTDMISAKTIRAIMAETKWKEDK